MLQKTQWTLTASALAVGVLLVLGARPAQAQFRIHLTGPVSTAPKTGIVIPPTSPTSTGIVVPKPTQTTAPVTTTVTAPVVKSPTPVVTPTPVVLAAPQGFSVGPSLLGAQRIPLGRVVNRVGPDLNGDGYSDIRKDPRSR
jgi:hypothetical protein